MILLDIIVISLSVVIVLYLLSQQRRLQNRFDEQQETISEVSRYIVLLEDVESVAAKIKDILIKHLQALNVSILLYEEDSQSFRFACKDDENRNAFSGKLYKQFFMFLETHDHIYTLKDVQRTKDASNTIYNQAKEYFNDVHAAMVVPLIFERRLIGVLNVERKKENKEFTDADKALAQSLRRQITVSFTNSMLFEKLSNVFEEVQQQNEELRAENSSQSGAVTRLLVQIKDPLLAIKRTFEQQNNAIYLEKIRHVEHKLNSILFYTQLEANSYQFKTASVSIEDIIYDAIREVDHLAEQKRIKISFSVQSTDKVIADRSLIKQSIIELLYNAIIHTEKGTITIDTNPHNDGVQITVVDTGKGISEHVLADIRCEKPHGLGLALVKRALRLHESELQVHSDLHQGSTFSFILKRSA